MPPAGAGTRIAHDMAPTVVGEVYGARSGDKGGAANVGVWFPATGDPGVDSARERGLDLLVGTPDAVRRLLPEAAPYDIDVHPLPNLRAVNVVIHGFLGRGVADSTSLDPQAKGLGELLRARIAELPVAALGRREETP
jgi:hypothetical protein